MESESIVYGCIRDWPGDSMERRMRRAANRRVLDSLPGGEAWPFLGREMFSRCEQSGAGLYQTQIIHFGASYQAIEYEWSLWVEQFEALLRRLYWASAVVHLETEVNGSHTFRCPSVASIPPGERPAGPLEASYAGRAMPPMAASTRRVAVLAGFRRALAAAMGDWLGVALCVVGASVVLFGPRLSQ